MHLLNKIEDVNDINTLYILHTNILFYFINYLLPPSCAYVKMESISIYECVYTLISRKVSFLLVVLACIPYITIHWRILFFFKMTNVIIDNNFLPEVTGGHPTGQVGTTHSSIDGKLRNSVRDLLGDKAQLHQLMSLGGIVITFHVLLFHLYTILIYTISIS